MQSSNLCCLVVLVASFAPATAANLRLASQGWVVALDKDLQTQMLVQVDSNGIKDPCEGISCAANLKCPAGFSSTKVEGHCCPYCVNPDIKLEAAVTGATGSNGGQASTFCPKVWCFPTMCTKTETAPTSTNGLCCPKC